MTPEELEAFSRRATDGRDRDRISELAKHFARIARDLDRRERRVERAIRVLQAAAALLIVFGFIGWLSLDAQSDRTDRANAKAKTAAAVAAQAAKAAANAAAGQEVLRYRATYTACLERGRTNDGIVAYLRKLGGTAEDIRRAREFFPRQPPCKAYTETLLGSPPPKGAYDLPDALKERVKRP